MSLCKKATLNEFHPQIPSMQFYKAYCTLCHCAITMKKSVILEIQLFEVWETFLFFLEHLFGCVGYLSWGFCLYYIIFTEKITQLTFQ